MDHDSEHCIYCCEGDYCSRTRNSVVLKKYYQAHKYGWFDYLYDLTEAKIDWFMVLVCIGLVAFIILLSKLGML